MCHSTLYMMKIYFGFTVAGNRASLDAARRFVALLEELGHQVLTRHLLEDGVREADGTLGPRVVYERDLAWLRECDLFIGEVSGSSFGIGFEAGYLLGATNKKVLLLYSTDVESGISLMIRGNTHPNCTLLPYTTTGEAEAALHSLLSTSS